MNGLCRGVLQFVAESSSEVLSGRGSGGLRRLLTGTSKGTGDEVAEADRISALCRFVAVVLTVLVVFLAVGSPLWADEDPVTLYEKGKSQLKSGNHEEAIASFSRSLELLDSDQRNAHVVLLARAQAYLSRGNLKPASDDIAQILGSTTVDGQTAAAALQLRGILHVKDGQDKKALEDFTEAIKRPHEDERLRAECFSNRAVALINLGQVERAIGDLNKAIELDPSSGYPYAARARAYLRLDKIELAKEDSERALKLKPDERTRKMVMRILKEMEVSATGPQSVQVPVSEDGHVYVQVRFSKQGPPHRFVLDTGATFTLVDRKLIAEISKETQVKEMGKGMVRIADGSNHQVTRYRIKTAFLYTLPLGEIEVHAFDNKKGMVSLNLLGMRSLRNISVAIDNSRRKAEITRTDGMMGREGETD